MLIALSNTAVAGAQSFTELLQRKVAGAGTITIHHSEDIDELVNGNTHVFRKGTSVNGSTASSDAMTGSTADGTLSEATTIHLHPSLVGKTYKTNGYRVQVLAGGNSRTDKLNASRAGNAIKSNYPDESVYVHFYTPRWICRVGNYRTYEEAHQMLIKVQEMGYKQATIVRGKITLKY